MTGNTIAAEPVIAFERSGPGTEEVGGTPTRAGRRTVLAVLTDDRLARLAASGDRAAFAVLYDRHHQALYRFARSIVRDPDDAADALQNTMLGALRGMSSRKPDVPVRAWLFRIAHNEAISIIRRRRPQAELTDAAGIEAATGAGGPEARERFRQLVSDLSALPERQRAALVMRELSGLDYSEIGAALATTEAGAKQTVYLARTALHERAEGRDMACEPVREAISGGDRRVLRGRRLKAHLSACAACQEFEAASRGRSAALAAFAPPISGVAAAGILSELLGAGVSHASAGAAGSGVAAGVGGGQTTVGAATAASQTPAVGAAAVTGGSAIGTAPATGGAAASALVATSAGAGGASGTGALLQVAGVGFKALVLSTGAKGAAVAAATVAAATGAASLGVHVDDVGAARASAVEVSLTADGASNRSALDDDANPMLNPRDADRAPGGTGGAAALALPDAQLGIGAETMPIPDGNRSRPQDRSSAELVRQVDRGGRIPLRVVGRVSHGDGPRAAVRKDGERTRREAEKARRRNRADARALRRDASTGNARRRDARAVKAPRRDARAVKAPRRDAGPVKAPRRDARAVNTPRRDADAGKAPRRDADAVKAPRREADAGDTPRRDADAGKAPRRDAGAGEAPRREADTGEAPQRDISLGKAPRGDEREKAPTGGRDEARRAGEDVAEVRAKLEVQSPEIATQDGNPGRGSGEKPSRDPDGLDAPPPLERRGGDGRRSGVDDVPRGGPPADGLPADDARSQGMAAPTKGPKARSLGSSATSG